MNIERWLEEFKNAWINHDIDAVMILFDEKVEYWETPHKLLGSFEELKDEWTAINSQGNINLTINLFNTDGNKSSVIWDLSYEKNSIVQKWSGTYLLEINELGKCTYFHQTGEQLLTQ